MEEIDVDVVRLQAAAGGLEGFLDLIGRKVIRGDLVGDDRLLAPPDERPAQHILSMARGVGLSRVEEGYSKVQRPVDGTDTLRVVGAAPPFAHRPGTQTEDRHRDTAPSKCSCFHYSVRLLVQESARRASAQFS